MSIFGSTEKNDLKEEKIIFPNQSTPALHSSISCLLYTSDAADE